MLLYIITEILAWLSGRPINQKAIIEKELKKMYKKELKKMRKKQKRNKTNHE